MSDAKFFLDTNIFVYSFEPIERQKCVISEKLVARALTSGLGVISYQVAQEFLNIALRKFEEPMSVPELERYFLRVLVPLMKVSSSAPLFLQSLHIQATSTLSWYDSLIIGAALQGECKTLYTEDLQHGRRFGELMVVNPFL
jgi:predicted nucleic acid-binding protein